MRFYNPGTAINERLPYTHPTKDAREGNTLSYFILNIGEKDFGDIPTTITLQADEGELVVPVGFAKQAKALHRERGLIMINPALKTLLDDDNAALTDEEAVAKGSRMWTDYLRDICNKHFATVADIRAHGNNPMRAQGTVAYALKALGIVDPADQVDVIMRAQEGKHTSDDMAAKYEALLAEVNKLKGAQNQRNQQRT